MAVGFSPKLPLQPDPVDGFYKLNKTLAEVAKQNLKMVVLTAPGERIIHPEFGVGARNYLFETEVGTQQNLSAKIVEQARRFVPYIEILNINRSDANLNTTETHNYKSTQYMTLQIEYHISNLNFNDTLELTIPTDF
jgi:phage baseplate assembly protein W